MRIQSHFLAGAVIAVFIASSTAPVAAQDGATDGVRRVANGERFKAWTVQCEAIAVNETLCVLSQRLVRESDRAFLAELLAFSATETDSRFIAARVPIGVHLPSGFAIKPADADDANEQKEFVWQSCSRDICEAVVELSAEEVAGLEAADTLIGGYRPAIEAQPLLFRLSIQGLEEGLTALGGGGATTR